MIKTMLSTMILASFCLLGCGSGSTDPQCTARRV